ncbi:SbcC/MukB-like Walker B domain-containing protein [Streptomyces sp. NPDC001034]|uniref:SbcC/MukB-like Walker B domain-containing protein n=1 Tax=Streptomyces sp. NPDC001034 TaxID=3154375 RepID=UPI0033233602
MDELIVPARLADRWHLTGAGVENVWRFPREVIDCPSGRCLVTGPNGTGKTTMLEKFCPHLLDPTAVQNLSSGKNRGTTLESLMKTGSTGRRRVGYVWLSFSPPQAGPEAGTQTAHYGLRLDYAQGTSPAVVRTGFMMPVVPGSDRDDLSVLSLEAFTEYVTGHGGTVFDCLDDYVADLAERVFGCAPAKLQQIARRIKKLRNPGLLGELTPGQAEQELHGVLPRVSPEVLDVTRQALAAAEATRARYMQAEKTAALLRDLSSAWLNSCARTVLSAIDDALDHCAVWHRAQAEAEEAETRAATSARRYEELTALVAELDVLEREKGARAQTLEQDAASSDLARAREKADLCTTGHQQAADLLLARRGAAAAAAEHLDAAVAGVRDVMASVTRACAEADVPGPLACPVQVERTEQASVTIGGRDFGTLTEITAEVSPGAVEETMSALGEAGRRQQQRSANAKMLVLAHQDVDTARQEGDQARTRADSAAETAEMALARHRDAHDAVHATVTALSHAVQQWAVTTQAAVRTPGFDLAAVAADAQQWPLAAEFTGAVRDAAALSGRVTTLTADFSSRARQRARHHQQQAVATRQAATQAAERARMWSSGKLPELPGPAWLETSDDSGCFAMAVDWRPGAMPAGVARDTAEAAMAAAGLLSATLTSQGLAGDSNWLVRPSGPELPVEDSLASILTPVPGRLAEVANAVLRRIGFAPTAIKAEPVGSGSDLLIGADGTYRCGPLAARPPWAVHTSAPTASHVGIEARRTAAQRAAAEAQRECDRFEQAAARHARASARFSQYETLLEQAAEQFPHELSTTASQAEAVRAECAVFEQDARTRATEADRLAQEKEEQFRRVLEQWRAQAAAYGLPDRLNLVHNEAETAARRASLLNRAVQEMGGVSALLEGVARAAQRAAASHEEADLSKQAALACFGRMSDALAALEACQQRSGMDEVALVREAAAARRAHHDVLDGLAQARAELSEANAAAAAARQSKTDAARRLQESRPRAEASLDEVHRCLALDGFAHALAWTEPDTSDGEEAGSWLEQLRERLSAVPRPSAGLDACTDALRHHLAAAAGEEWSMGYGPAPERMPAHQMSLAGRRMSPFEAAKVAAERQAEALNAYSAADEHALENFILGRIPAAISTAWVELQDWVDTINDQMKLTAASSGVGVQIDIALRRDLAPSIATIHHLTCEKGEADRSPEEQRRIGQELLAVMRLGEQDHAGPGSQRADRLSEAIDIRTWVTVKYLITRPGAARRERWGARGVTVSKGESRLIVLAPLLAALAAEYRDLPPHAARLCALDEVPGDVDDHGRDGIAAYLASLDLDLMSTSHNWDGSPGAWDGIDIFELEKGPDDTVIAFPVRVYSLQLQHAIGQHAAAVPDATAPSSAGS